MRLRVRETILAGKDHGSSKGQVGLAIFFALIGILATVMSFASPGIETRGGISFGVAAVLLFFAAGFMLYKARLARKNGQ
jgi:hypothetical protein